MVRAAVVGHGSARIAPHVPGRRRSLRATRCRTSPARPAVEGAGEEWGPPRCSQRARGTSHETRVSCILLIIKII